MASTPNPYTEDHIRHLRLHSLLFDLGTRTIKRKFEKLLISKYSDLQDFLDKKWADIDTDKYINNEQFKLLYPQGQAANIENFDISLLTTLIQSYFHGQHGYKSIKYVQYVRNDFQHKTKVGIKAPEYNSVWSEVSRHLTFLDNDPNLSNEIDAYKTKEFADEEIKTFLQYLKLLVDANRSEFSKKLSEVDEKLEKVGEKVSDLSANVNELKKEKGTKPRLQILEDEYQDEVKFKENRRKDLLDKIKEELKSDYKDLPLDTIRLRPMNATKPVSFIRDIYIHRHIRLTEKCDKKQADNKPIQNTEDIQEIEKFIKELSDDAQRLRLIVSGNPGCGKSIQCNKIMYDWSIEGTFLSQKYALVILLKAREFSSQQDMFLAMTKQMPHKYQEENKQEIKTILQQNKILILLDGYDELKDKDHQPDLKDLLENKRMYKNCDVIITTQPDEPGIEALIKEVRYQTVNIAPFNDKNIRDFARNFFESESTEEQGAVNVDAFYDAATSEHVKDLAREPLTLLFLCFIWQKNEGRKLPKIRTRLYKDLLDVLRERYYNKIGCKSSVQVWNSLLDRLGKLAFNKLTEKEGSILVFEDPCLETIADRAKGTTLDAVDLACSIGLLTKADATKKDSDDSYEPLVNVSNYYQFAHLSLQECLGARYFYNTFDNNNLLKILEHRIVQSGNFIHFVCGYVSLDKEVNDLKLKKLNLLLQVVLRCHRFVFFDENEIKLWEETGCHPLYKWVLVDNNNIGHYYDNVSDGNTFCAEQASRLKILSPDKAYDKNTEFNCEHGFCLSAICKALKDTHTLGIVRLEHLKCDCENRADGLLEFLKNNEKIEGIGIDHCDITPDIAKRMAPHLSRHLRSLIMRGNPLQDSICDIISNLPNTIEVIVLNDCGITADHATMISPSFSKFTKLESLDLAKNRIEKGAEAIMANLNKTVYNLNMSNCGITETVAKIMAPHLAKLIALRRDVLCECNLSGNPIGGGAVAVVEHINKSIHYLQMENCGITQTAAEGMAPHLTELQELQWLNLSGNLIGGGAVAVVEHLSDSIQDLHMNNCRITTEHVRKMVAHLNINKLGCFSLSLADNGISEDDQKELGRITNSLHCIDW